MPETYLIQFHIQPSQRDRFLNLLTRVLDAMQHEATFVDARLSQDADDPNRFILHETWADRQDVMEVELKRPYRDTWHAALPDLLQAARDVRILQPVWQPRAA